MPISSHAVIPYILEEAFLKKPKRVLDIGIGNGIYGALINNYATVLLDRIPTIIGIEPWRDYRGPMWDLYHEVINTDVNLIQDGPVKDMDVIIMADVIEHMDLDVGHELIRKLKTWLAPGGILLISTPGVFVEQGAYKGNKYEIHKSLWTQAEAEKSGMEMVKPADHTLFGEQMLVFKYTNKTGG